MHMLWLGNLIRPISNFVLFWPIWFEHYLFHFGRWDNLWWEGEEAAVAQNAILRLDTCFYVQTIWKVVFWHFKDIFLRVILSINSTISRWTWDISFWIKLFIKMSGHEAIFGKVKVPSVARDLLFPNLAKCAQVLITNVIPKNNVKIHPWDCAIGYFISCPPPLWNTIFFRM